MRARPALAYIVALWCFVGLVGCKTSPDGSSSEPGVAASATSATKKADPHVHFEPAPPGDLAAIVQSAVSKAQADGRRLVVYEGATWCEPCQRFHAAVAAGQLDATFPDLTFLELDADRDRDRIIAAGYSSEYIPLFALPGKDGRAAGPKASGGIKGDGAVAYLTNKLKMLLAQGTGS